MSRLQQRLEHCAAEGRAALIPYLTGGDPEPAATPALMHALVEGGADILELGVPFTDPMADGPTIQLACERALAAGTTVTHVLDAVRTFRERERPAGAGHCQAQGAAATRDMHIAPRSNAQ